MEPALLDLIIEALEDQGAAADLVTAAAPTPEAATSGSHVVKVVLDGRGRALYFSRAPIPFFRDPAAPVRPLQHLGVYGFRREALLRFAALPPSPLERAEGLEQLRALEAGMVVRVLLTDRAVPGIDTREDYDAFLGRIGCVARMGSSGR
jgi:3-deoxy-manno-octulosonate cytidylyltransferase (CMP-KDO synthetase)